MTDVEIEEADLQKAYEGSYYTISGTGGDLAEWVAGYEKWFADEGIGKPVKWLQTTGAAINRFCGETGNPYADDLMCLMFPLDGLNMAKLPLFKLRAEDRWFDDVIDNMRRQ